MKSRLSLSISEEALEMLDAAAKAHGVSRSQMCERSVRCLLQKAPPMSKKEEIKAFYERLVDERIDLAEELMGFAKQKARVEGVRVSRVDYLNGLVITTIEDPFADPREMVLRSGMSTALVKLEVDKPEGDE